MRATQLEKQKGFSLIELMVVAAVFTIITGAVFTVLIVAEQRYKIESEVLNSFNGANVAMDQMTRDIHMAGYPPANSFQVGVAPAPAQVALPFSWPGVNGYPNATCTMGGGTCGAFPANYDIIIEENPDPMNPASAVNWIRYQLPAGSHTLMRAMVQKNNAAPGGQTSGVNVLVPYLDGVMNNASPTEMATIKQYYPNMFPGNVQVPIFTYYCDSAAGPVLCTAANTPLDIREVQIVLIVQSSSRDMKTLAPRIVTLTGQAERVNPNK